MSKDWILPLWIAFFHAEDQEISHNAPCHTRCWGDFGWLLSAILTGAKDFNVFSISCFAVDIRMFPTSVFYVRARPQFPPNNPKKEKKYLKHTHTWDFLHNDTHTQASAGAVTVKSSHMNARNTCRQGELGVFYRSRTILCGAFLNEFSKRINRLLAASCWSLIFNGQRKKEKFKKLLRIIAVLLNSFKTLSF